MKKTYELEFYGKKLVVELGEMAKQAAGSAFIRYGDTAVLSVGASSSSPATVDFFPLMVLYQEKLYSAGKIPGGFIKREGRPSENATLTARLIDRPIRPLFPKGFKYDVQVVSTVMSVDTDHSPEMSAMFGSSLALMLSPLPFLGPIAGVVVGLVDGNFIINPTPAQLEKSEIDLTVAGTKEAINMVEAGAKEVTEDIMLDAIMFGHEAIKTLIEFQEKIISDNIVDKMEYCVNTIDAELEKKLSASVLEEVKDILKEFDKETRNNNINDLKVRVLTNYEADFHSDIQKIIDNLVKDEMRRKVLEESVRVDGRKLNEIRNLDSQIDILPRVHGSSLFTRGQTQCLSITTLGTLREYQIIDGLGVEDQKRFMLHYNFPAFSVGETGRYGAPGRREVGHGALGERALLQILPSEEEFPYTIRVVSEILESNGSTSQASICAGCMSLMAAGVPIKAPVAGIAMGLISDGNKHRVLSDIQGLEDHLGDMDFKVAGTKNGIVALQMDIKIMGLSREILSQALLQAKTGRLEILDNMVGAISDPKEELSKFAPKIRQIMIPIDKIKDVIGRGGETITKIIENCDDVKIDIEDDGRVIIYHTNYESINKAVEIIENLTRTANVGEFYDVEVIRIEKFGAFVRLWDGCEGMVHISQLAHKRVEKVEKVVKIGDVFSAKVIKIDDRGRIDLSKKSAMVKEAIVQEKS
ncbi:MAG: polyribonucleotide nucleotidyltransferase [Bacilli bacterium]